MSANNTYYCIFILERNIKYVFRRRGRVNCKVLKGCRLFANKFSKKPIAEQFFGRTSTRSLTHRQHRMILHTSPSSRPLICDKSSRRVLLTQGLYNLQTSYQRNEINRWERDNDSIFNYEVCTYHECMVLMSLTCFFHSQIVFILYIVKSQSIFIRKLLRIIERTLSVVHCFNHQYIMYNNVPAIAIRTDKRSLQCIRRGHFRVRSNWWNIDVPIRYYTGEKSEKENNDVRESTGHGFYRHDGPRSENGFRIRFNVVGGVCHHILLLYMILYRHRHPTTLHVNDARRWYFFYIFIYCIMYSTYIIVVERRFIIIRNSSRLFSFRK